MVAALSLGARLGLPLALLVTPVAGQATRAIALPDTLGANFAIADSAKGLGSATDFDFLLGTWHFTFQPRRPDGTFTPAFSGHWTALKRDSEHYTDEQKDVETAYVEDQWRPDDESAPSSAGIYTYRAYTSRRHLWAIQGVNTYVADWEPGLAWADSANRYLIQRRGTTISRIRYFAITPTQFSWRADMSTDGGKTWLLDRGTMRATRVGK